MIFNPHKRMSVNHVVLLCMCLLVESRCTSVCVPSSKAYCSGWLAAKKEGLSGLEARHAGNHARKKWLGYN